MSDYIADLVYNIAGPQSSFYVIHLAFADLLCCVINMPVNAYSIFSKGWFVGEKLCIISAAFCYIAIYVDWMIVALIAFSKCVHLFKPQMGKMIFSGLSGHLIALSLWLIAILFFLLEHLWVILNFDAELKMNCNGLGFRKKFKQMLASNEICSLFLSGGLTLAGFFSIFSLNCLVTIVLKEIVTS